MPPMYSKVKRVKLDAVNDETDICTVNECLFCNEQLDGESKILECLHIVCNNCIAKKKITTGIKCKCSHVTKGKLTEYPIASAASEKIKKCSVDTCMADTKQICIYCQKLYCTPCSKVHISQYNDHNPSFIQHYPMKNELVLCSCKNRFSEIYCTECSVMICGLCHLEFHRIHKFETIKDLEQNIKINLKFQICELSKNKAYFDYNISQTEKQIENLEMEKKIIEEKIDIQMEKLYLEIKKRSLELKKLNNTCFSNSMVKINENKQILNELRKQNNYFIDLTESILNHDKILDITMLSEPVLRSLTHSSRSDIIFELKEVPGLKFDYDKTFEIAVSKIKAVGNITSVSVDSLSQINSLAILKDNPQALENMLLIDSINEDNIINIDFKSDDSDTFEDEPIIKCLCCNQWAKTLMKCDSCARHFHNDCHIPMLPANMNVKKWICTLCRDTTKFSKILIQIKITDINAIGCTERKILDELLEMYCQINEDENFRDSTIIKKICPEHYKKVPNLISLYDYKKRLESDQSYALPDFLKDLIKAYSNASLFFPPKDKYSLFTFKRLASLSALFNKWIHQFDRTH